MTLQAQHQYKIHVFYVDRTYQSIGHKKSVVTISDQREYKKERRGKCMTVFMTRLV